MPNKIIIAFFALIFSCNLSYAQQKPSAADFYAHGMQYLNTEPDSAHYFFYIAELAAIQKNDTAGIYLAYNGLGQYYMNAGKMDTALIYLNSSKEYCAQFYGRQHVEYSTALNNLARYYHLNQQPKKSSIYYDSVVNLYRDVLKLKKTADYAQILVNRSALLIESSQTAAAISDATEATNVVKNLLGDKSFEYANVLYNLGSVQFKAGNPTAAINTLQAPIAILQTLNMQNSLLNAQVTNSQGLALAGIGKWWMARDNYLLTDAILKNIGQENTLYAAIIKQNIGQLFTETAQYAKAKKYFTASRDIFTKNNAINRPEFIDLLNNEAILYDFLDQHSKAGNLYKKALNLSQVHYGPNHQQTILQLNNLSSHYGQTANKDSALLYIRKAIKRAKNSYGTNHPTYAKFLTNLAYSQAENGLNNEAENTYLKSKLIFERGAHTNTPAYAEVLDQLARFYGNKDAFEKSFLLFDKALVIKDSLFGKNHPSYAGTLQNLANICLKTGQLHKAQDYFLSALEIYQKSYTPGPTVATIQTNLAQLYQKIGQYEKAKKYLFPALRITYKVFGKEHPTYGVMLGNLSTLYAKQDSAAPAQKNAEQALQIIQNHYGTDHPETASQLNNLAFVHFIKGDYQKAVEGYKKSLKILENNYGQEHGTYGEILNNLMMLFAEKGDLKQAVFYAKKTSQQSKNMIEKLFRFSTEEEKKSFVDIQTPRQELIQKIAMQSGNTDLIKIGLNNQLLLKGLVLAQSKNIIKELSSLNDQELDKKITKYGNLKNQIAALQQKPWTEEKVASIKVKAAKIETELVKLYSKISNIKSNNEISWEAIQKTLAKNEIAIEFTHFADQAVQRKDSTYYAAYVISPKIASPILVSITEEGELKSVLNKNNQPNQLLALRGSIAENRERITLPSQQLYNLIWSPINEHLAGVEKIFYSTSGILHEIPFAALPFSAEQTLSQVYELEQKNNLSILTNKTTDKSINKIVCFGNVDYNYRTNARFDKPLSHFNKKTWTPKPIWKPLTGTKTESIAIKNISAENEVNSTVYEKGIASEKHFKSLSGQPADVIHLATHGFFYGKEKNDANIYTRSVNPMLRTGLILSGGNLAWQNYSYQLDGENGILTALEISNLDLSNTQLVVLSACETALGDIRGSEGVYGLQRAFKMAGVNKIIMSLWKVPDNPTAKFMKLFYTYWLTDKMNLQEAFRATQLKMQADNHPPVDWAGFVLVE